MHWADPSFATGLQDDPDATDLWRAIFTEFGGAGAKDAEFLHVAALMVRLFPHALGDQAEWLANADRMEAQLRHLKPDGFPAGTFEGRGDYGEYFAHQARGR